MTRLDLDIENVGEVVLHLNEREQRGDFPKRDEQVQIAGRDLPTDGVGSEH